MRASLAEAIVVGVLDPIRGNANDYANGCLQNRRDGIQIELTRPTHAITLVLKDFNGTRPVWTIGADDEGCSPY